MHGLSRLPYDQQWGEYEALVVGPDPVKAAGATSMIIYCDSQVIMSQVNGDYECIGKWMKKFLE